MSVYIGYCFYLCGETAQAAGDVAERASETARLFGLECIGGTQQLCSLFLCVEIRFGAFHVVADQCRIVQDAVKLIESGADRAQTVILSAVMAVGVCGGRTGARHHGAASVGSCHFVKAAGGVKRGAAAQYADGAFLLVDKLLEIPDPFAKHHHLLAQRRILALCRSLFLAAPKHRTLAGQ